MVNGRRVQERSSPKIETPPIAGQSQLLVPALCCPFPSNMHVWSAALSCHLLDCHCISCEVRRFERKAPARQTPEPSMVTECCTLNSHRWHTLQLPYTCDDRHQSICILLPTDTMQLRNPLKTRSVSYAHAGTSDTRMCRWMPSSLLRLPQNVQSHQPPQPKR